MKPGPVDIPNGYSLATHGKRFRFTRPGFMSESFDDLEAAAKAAWDEASKRKPVDGVPPK